MRTLVLEKGYEVLQDVHGKAEERGLTGKGFEPTDHPILHLLSEFQPIDHPAHLQLLFEEQPDFGRHLRFYNQAPWWYRLRFRVPEDAPPHAVLRVGAADYFAEVWLNGVRLGSHEGYFHSFEFGVDGVLDRSGMNELLIKVSSPWDPEECLPGLRCGQIIRRMIKGTYEHADSFGCRDVNPVGLWKPCEIDFYDRGRMAGIRVVTSVEGTSGRLKAEVRLDGGQGRVRFTLREADTGRRVWRRECGGCIDDVIPDIRLWTSYERGLPACYRLSAELIEDGEAVQCIERTIGFRTVELRRTPDRTEYYLNGERFFVRGCSYLPDFYLSRLSEARIRRDLEQMVSLGINMVRVHVHAQLPAFYEYCDELGLLVMQDNDLNWTFDMSEGFLDRALDVFGQLLDYVGHHPCVCTICAINEPNYPVYMEECPGPQLEALAASETPGIPVIRGSCQYFSLHSGDSHNYAGALFEDKRSYLDNELRDKEKLNTEFGMDCPPVPESLRNVPKLYERLALTQEKSEELQEYQYRLIKHFIENYRIRKYNPCAGYMQFLYSDPLPQSFFGVYDFFGVPKKGLQAIRESGGRFAAILEADTESRALWAVNDTTDAWEAELKAEVTDPDGNTIRSIRQAVRLAPDSAVRVCELKGLPERCIVFLRLTAEDGRVLAVNRYVDPMRHPAHPEGHPFYIDSEYCVPLYRKPGAARLAEGKWK